VWWGEVWAVSKVADGFAGVGGRGGLAGGRA
jgi:hypothetical protein